MTTLQSTLTPQLARATKIVLIHRRCSSFRLRGLWELMLMVVGAVFVVAYFIGMGILMLVGGGGLGDGNGEGSGGPVGRSSGNSDADELPVSRFKHYFQTLEVRLLDAQGVCLAHYQTRANTPTEGDRFVAEVLALAAQGRLLVEERAAGTDDPQMPGMLVAHWYGGRPFQGPPEKRDPAQLEAALTQAGFSFERAADDSGKVTVTRNRDIFSFQEAVANLIIVPALIALAALAFSLQFGPFAPFIAVALIPVALVAAIVKRREIKDFLLSILGGLLHAKERHRLELGPEGLRYRGRTLWSQQRFETQGAELLAVNLRGTLTFDRKVGYETPRLVLVAPGHTVALPPTFTGDVASIFHEWLLSVLEQQQAQIRMADASSRCSYCGSLYDWDQTPNCPGCGAAHPRANRSALQA